MVPVALNAAKPLAVCTFILGKSENLKALKINYTFKDNVEEVKLSLVKEIQNNGFVLDIQCDCKFVKLMVYFS